ncbi:transcription termination factor Rho, partial [Escherichia coli]|nr:transcription termination factor Rho [Escherichia coli]
QELPIIYRLRRLRGGMEPEQAYQTLVPRLKKTATNRDFLAAIVQQANTGNAVNGN